MGYKVSVSIDYMDPNPDDHYFDTFDEAQDFVHESVEEIVQWRVDHSPTMVSEKERNEFFEEEFQLFRLTAV